MAQTLKCLPTMRETRVLIPGSGRSPVEGNGNPLQYSCPPPRKKGAQRNIFWRREWQPTPVFLPLPPKKGAQRNIYFFNPLPYSYLENPIDGGVLVGYRLQSHKESDTTERLHFHFNWRKLYRKTDVQSINVRQWKITKMNELAECMWIWTNLEI